MFSKHATPKAKKILSRCSGKLRKCVEHKGEHAERMLWTNTKGSVCSCTLLIGFRLVRHPVGRNKWVLKDNDNRINLLKIIDRYVHHHCLIISFAQSYIAYFDSQFAVLSPGLWRHIETQRKNATWSCDCFLSSLPRFWKNLHLWSDR